MSVSMENPPPVSGQASFSSTVGKAFSSEKRAPGPILGGHAMSYTLSRFSSVAGGSSLRKADNRLPVCSSSPCRGIAAPHRGCRDPGMRRAGSWRQVFAGGKAVICVRVLTSGVSTGGHTTNTHYNQKKAIFSHIM